MLKLFGSFATKIQSPELHQTERYSRFESVQPDDNCGAKYTRMSAQHKRRRPARVTEPRACTVTEPNETPLKSKPAQIHSTGFDETVHLYASDDVSVDVIRKALPQRFEESR